MIFNVGVSAPTFPVLVVDNVQYAEANIDNEKFKLVSDTSNWGLWIKQSCTLKFVFIPKNSNVDYCLVGAGSKGDNGTAETNASRGGNGGRGGEVNNFTDEAISLNTDYAIEIGQSNPQTNTTFNSQTAISGNRGSAGSGSNSWSGPVHATSGTDGTYAFNDSTFDDTLYGACGGGGGSCCEVRGGSYIKANSARNGGDATKWSTSEATTPNANTGSGGGGGGARRDWTGEGSPVVWSGNGANGSSGIVILRNHRA